MQTAKRSSFARAQESRAMILMLRPLQPALLRVESLQKVKESMEKGKEKVQEREKKTQPALSLRAIQSLRLDKGGE